MDTAKDLRKATNGNPAGGCQAEAFAGIPEAVSGNNGGLKGNLWQVYG